MAVIKRGIESSAPKKYPSRRLRQRERKLAEAIEQSKNIDEDFNAPLVISAVDQESNLLATSTLAAGDEIAMRTDKHTFLAHVQSVHGTVVNTFPTVSADGLEVVVDADAADGVTGWEITNGILSTSRAAHTVGSTDGHTIYCEAVIKIDDISDVTELGFGFRKAEAFRAAVDDYDEMASFNVGQDADGQIEIHTIINNAATAETDTTLTDWADAGVHTLRIEVDKNGKCMFLFDGAEPTVTASFTFDAGEVIVPFLFLKCETGDPGVSISSWECGYK